MARSGGANVSDKEDQSPRLAKGQDNYVAIAIHLQSQIRRKE